MPLIEDACAHT